mmetsp:Transcript_95163/g.217917  ORF Transcript_95163/g.217917 Transcript_95163/m.217917 type:complete len:86 (-) Transcript_95163:169-426(-)
MLAAWPGSDMEDLQLKHKQKVCTTNGAEVDNFRGAASRFYRGGSGGVTRPSWLPLVGAEAALAGRQASLGPGLPAGFGAVLQAST